MVLEWTGLPREEEKSSVFSRLCGCLYHQDTFFLIDQTNMERDSLGKRFCSEREKEGWLYKSDYKERRQSESVFRKSRTKKFQRIIVLGDIA